MTTQVCGTPLFVATDDDRQRTLLASDFHIGSDGGQVLAGFRRLVAIAREKPDETRLCLLGDLFDAFIGRKQLRVGAWLDVAQELKAAADAGVSITALWGNRDFMLDEAFERAASCRVIGGGLRIQLAGCSTLLLHGDELCLNDVPYQRSKAILRGRVARFLSRSLPLPVSRRIAGGIRKKSKKSVASGDQDRFHPVSRALSEVFDLGVDRLVFGHIHRASRGRFGARGEYVVLPAFDETGVFLEAKDGELFYRNLDGERLADYPSREFPP